PAPAPYSPSLHDALPISAGLVARVDRVALRVYGRDPLKMIQGLITNDLAGAPEGQGVYAAFLTPKGKMVADARVFRRSGGELLIDRKSTRLNSSHVKTSQ